MTIQEAANHLFHENEQFKQLSEVYDKEGSKLRAYRNKFLNWQDFWESKGLILNRCPQCKTGTLVYLYPLDPVRGPPNTDSFATINTSKS